MEKLVALNKERAAEEEQGFVRYLRPEYQAPEEAQTQAVQQIVTSAEDPLTAEEVAQRFRYGRRKQIRQLLDTLDTLGLVRAAGEGRFAG